MQRPNSKPRLGLLRVHVGTRIPTPARLTQSNDRPHQYRHLVSRFRRQHQACLKVRSGASRCAPAARCVSVAPLASATAASRLSVAVYTCTHSVMSESLGRTNDPPTRGRNACGSEPPRDSSPTKEAMKQA